MQLTEFGDWFENDSLAVLVDEHLARGFDAEFIASGFGIVACPFCETRTISGSSVVLAICSCTIVSEYY